MSYSEAQRLIYSMLTENTGAHPLDSGGAYGRHWQRNQHKTIEDFDREPEEMYVWDGQYITRTLSVFHYLSQLELDEVCDQFNVLNTDADDWDADTECYGVSIEAWYYLTENYHVKVERVFNTYNGDCDLTQTLQGAWLEIDDEKYLLLQIHNGCDVRGGYTDAKLFSPNDEGLIHEYLMEYKDNYDIVQDWEYITIQDEQGNTIQDEQVLNNIKESIE